MVERTSVIAKTNGIGRILYPGGISETEILLSGEIRVAGEAVGPTWTQARARKRAVQRPHGHDPRRQHI
jgi:hypothetical protein